MSKGRYAPCDGHINWPRWTCPSGDPRCMGCHLRPDSPSVDVEVGIGGGHQLSREVVRALARVLGIRRRDVGLTAGQVERILEKWIELQNFGGSRNADVGTRTHEEPGALLWVATVEAKVWRDPSEYVPLMDDRGMVAEWQPVVRLVAELRWFELPALRAEKDQSMRCHMRSGGREGNSAPSDGRITQAESELAKLTRTKQYKAAMSRLAVEFAACPWDFLRVALGPGLDNRRNMSR